MAKSGKSGGGSSQSHTQYRSAKSGRFVTERRAEHMKPENVVKERIPNASELIGLRVKAQ